MVVLSVRDVLNINGILRTVRLGFMSFARHVKIKTFRAFITNIVCIISMLVLMCFQVPWVVAFIITFITCPRLSTVHGLMFIHFPFVFEPFITLTALIFKHS